MSSQEKARPKPLSLTAGKGETASTPLDSRSEGSSEHRRMPYASPEIYIANGGRGKEKGKEINPLAMCTKLIAPFDSHGNVQPLTRSFVHITPRLLPVAGHNICQTFWMMFSGVERSTGVCVTCPYSTQASFWPGFFFSRIDKRCVRFFSFLRQTTMRSAASSHSSRPHGLVAQESSLRPVRPLLGPGVVGPIRWGEAGLKRA